jgi:6-pyruvoyltetrahydropterin/6-carboxytetrahydropterin synthase
MEIFKEFSFDAAHSLPQAPDGHKCRNMHGHTWRVTIHLTGPVDQQYGWLIDFGEIGAAFDPLLERLDHSVLNEIEGLENPTSEVLVRWIWEQVAPRLPLLSKIVVQETITSGCVYRGE